MVLVFTFVGDECPRNESVLNCPYAYHSEGVVINSYFNRKKESYTGSQVTIQSEGLKKVGIYRQPGFMIWI